MKHLSYCLTTVLLCALTLSGCSEKTADELSKK